MKAVKGVWPVPGTSEPRDAATPRPLPVSDTPGASAPVPLPLSPSTTTGGAGRSGRVWVWVVVAVVVVTLLACSCAAVFLSVRRALLAIPPAASQTRIGRDLVRQYPAFDVTDVRVNGSLAVAALRYRRVPGLEWVVRGSAPQTGSAEWFSPQAHGAGDLFIDRPERVDGFARLWVKEHPGTFVWDVVDRVTTPSGAVVIDVAYVGSFMQAAEPGPPVLSDTLVWEPTTDEWRKPRPEEAEQRSPVLTEKQALEMVAAAYPAFRVVDTTAFTRPGSRVAYPCVVLESRKVPGFRWAVDPVGGNDADGSLTTPYTIAIITNKDPAFTEFQRWWVKHRPKTVVWGITGLTEAGGAWSIAYFKGDGPFSTAKPWDAENVFYSSPPGPGAGWSF